MPEDLKTYELEHAGVQKVFIQPSVGEHDSASSCCCKLEIERHIKGFNLLELMCIKQPPAEYSE